MNREIETPSAKVSDLDGVAIRSEIGLFAGSIGFTIGTIVASMSVALALMEKNVFETDFAGGIGAAGVAGGLWLIVKNHAELISAKTAKYLIISKQNPQ